MVPGAGRDFSRAFVPETKRRVFTPCTVLDNGREALLCSRTNTNHVIVGFGTPVMMHWNWAF